MSAALISASSPVSGGEMGLQTIPVGQLTATVGQHLHGPDESDAGRRWDVLVGSSGQPHATVIEYGGFPRTGRRKVAVAWTTLRFEPGDRRHPLAVLLNKTEMGWTADFKSATGPTTFGRPAPTGNSDTSN